METENELQMAKIGTVTWKDGFKALRWLGLGGRFYELREVVPVQNPGPSEPGWRRVVRAVDWQTIKEVEIWGLDTCDL